MVNFINNNLASFFMLCFIASTLRNADCDIFELGQYNPFPAPTESDCYKLLLRAELISQRTEGNEVKYLKHYSWENAVSSVLSPLCKYIQQDGVDNGKSVRIFSDLTSMCGGTKDYENKELSNLIRTFLPKCNVVYRYGSFYKKLINGNGLSLSFEILANTCDSLNTFKLGESGQIDPLNVEQFHKLCNIVYKLGDDDTQLPHAICADYKPISNMQPDTNHP